MTRLLRLFRTTRIDDVKRLRAERESEEVRIHLRSLAEELKRSIDRLETVVARMETEMEDTRDR